MIGPLRLRASYVDGRLVLTIPSTGGSFAVLPLDEVDAADTLDLLAAGHDVGRWLFASLDDLDRALDREGWRRLEPWSGDGDGTTTLVEAAT